MRGAGRRIRSSPPKQALRLLPRTLADRPDDDQGRPLPVRSARSRPLGRTRLTHPSDFRQTNALVVAWKTDTRSIMLDCDGAQLDSSRWNVGPANLLAVSLPMLARWVFTVWGAWLGALGLAAALTASRVWNPNPILPLGLLGPDVGGGARPGDRGDRPPDSRPPTRPGPGGPARGDGAVLVPGRAHPDGDRGRRSTAMCPPGGRPGSSRRWPGPSRTCEARWFYPERTPGKWVTMVGARAEDARAQVAAMDRHVEALAGPARPIRDLADRLVSGAAPRPAAVRHLRHGDRVRSRPGRRAGPTA